MKSSYFSTKVFTCSLCKEQRTGNYSEEAVRIICWVCIGKLMYAPKEQIEALRQGLKERGKLVESFMEDDVNEDGGDMARKGSCRTFRLKNRQNRQVKNFNKMDRRRPRIHRNIQ